MEPNPNIIRLLEMLESPEAYTEQEIRNIIDHDEETRQAYRTMVAAKQGYHHKQAGKEVDVEAAWERFEQKTLSPNPSPSSARALASVAPDRATFSRSVERSLPVEGEGRPSGMVLNEKAKDKQSERHSPRPLWERGWGRGSFFRKIAASIIGFLLITGLTFAAVQVVRHIDSNPKVAVAERKPDVKKVKKTYGVAMAPTKKAPVLFNNVELQEVMKYIADGYGVKVVFKNDAARTIRFYVQWEADDTLQMLIDRINHFEKVHLTLSEETIMVE